MSSLNLAAHTPELLVEEKYNSTAVLLYLSKHIPVNTKKCLAISQRDLYSPIFSHLYGEAQLEGTCALMSLYRLRQEFYNQSPDPELFISRCRKEAVHETAHTFGLLHCSNRYCVMYPSSTINDTDEKSDVLCPVCVQLLEPRSKS